MDGSQNYWPLLGVDYIAKWEPSFGKYPSGGCIDSAKVMSFCQTVVRGLAGLGSGAFVKMKF